MAARTDTDWLRVDHPFVMFASEGARRVNAVLQLQKLISAARKGVAVHDEIRRICEDPAVFVGDFGRIVRPLLTTLADGPLPRHKKAAIEAIDSQVLKPLVGAGYDLNVPRGGQAKRDLRCFLFSLCYLAWADGLILPSAKSLHDISKATGFAERYSKNPFGTERAGLFDRYVREVVHIRYEPNMRSMFPMEATPLAHVVSEINLVRRRAVPSPARLADYVFNTQTSPSRRSTKPIPILPSPRQALITHWQLLRLNGALRMRDA